MWVYKIMVVCWIIFGLGYLLMILGYISKAYRSKKVRRMERKIRRRLRGASEKISRVSREAKDIKRLANALNLVVVKVLFSFLLLLMFVHRLISASCGNLRLEFVT